MNRRRTLGPLGRAMAARLPRKVREQLLGPPAWRRRNWLRGGVAVASYAIVMLFVVFGLEPMPPDALGTVWLLAPGIVAIAFVFQTLDATSGMGFGTALTPLLFAAGYGPLDVVPALLIAQAFTGLLTGWLHFELETVRFSFRRPYGTATRALAVVAGTGLVATISSILLAYVAVPLPDTAIETYVALLVIAMGLSILVRGIAPARREFRQSRLVVFALLAGANKGISGGGYGPVVTLGAMHAGLPAKAAAAITVLAEGFVSFAGVCTFVMLMGKLEVDFSLVPSILTGSFVAALAAPFLMNFLPMRIYRVLVPGYALIIGVVVLVRLYVI